MKKILYYLVAATLLLQACSSQATPTTPAPSIDATEAQVITVEPASSPIPAATDAVVATAVSVPTDSVAHETIPGEGTSDRATAHDNDNAISYETKVVRSGDEFFRNRFERPFTANDMQYLPDLDIVNFSITSDDTFFYIKISFVGLDAATQSLTGSYAVEIDRNADGRAEILLATKPPYTQEFSPDNVMVYLDLNSNVGGSKINRHDDFPGDGFEADIFDMGKNIYPEGDPDLAWVRQTTDGSLPAIEIAYKKWIFKDGKENFMWSVDSSATQIDPTKLYFQDAFTAEEAGAANNEDANYPIKALSAMDNTCRVPFGFNATGNEPLGCFVGTSDSEKQNAPSSEGPNSTCGQFGELCNRTQGRLEILNTQ